MPTPGGLAGAQGRRRTPAVSVTRIRVWSGLMVWLAVGPSVLKMTGLPLRLDVGRRDGSMQVMTDGFVMGPGEGEQVSPAMTLKVGDKNSEAWSMFEVVAIGPGFDVGAHLHRNA